MELDAPRVLDPVGLGADRAAGQLDRAGGERVGVVMPLKGVEPFGQRAHDGVVRRGGRALDGEPADLRFRRAEHFGARRPGDELGAEADAEQRGAAVEQALEPAQLRRQPAVALVLVGMHRTAEDDHRIGTLRRRAAELDRPLDELVPGLLHGVSEHAGADARAVRQRKYTHGPSAPATSLALQG